MYWSYFSEEYQCRGMPSVYDDTVMNMARLAVEELDEQIKAAGKKILELMQKEEAQLNAEAALEPGTEESLVLAAQVKLPMWRPSVPASLL